MEPENKEDKFAVAVITGGNQSVVNERQNWNICKNKFLLLASESIS